MHMMFVDESGDPGFPPGGKWKKWGGSKYYTRVGVVIHGWKWQAWNQHLLEFKDANGLNWDSEIRASDIRRGTNAFAGWKQPRRRKFLLDIAELIGQNEDITLLGVLIDKKKIDVKKRRRLVRPEIRSLELLLEQYNLFLGEQKDKSGIVILDPVKEASDDNIRRFQSYLLAQSPRLRPLHLVEGTFFAKSHTSNMIQISDICSNIFYREHTRPGRTREYRHIYKRFLRRNNRVAGHGIKKWPR